MKNFSTRCMDKMMNKETGKNNGRVTPCKQTLALLTQFARVYHAVPTVQKGLCAFVVN
jgi:hypothetical protein